MGDRVSHLKSAAQLVRNTDGIDLHGISGVYESDPWGKSDQPRFLNQVIETETAFSPSALLGVCQRIEKDLGRTMQERWGPRLIDIDILLYGDRIIHETNLEIPHPYLAERKFVLVPLAELNPGMTVPGTGHTVTDLLKSCSDESDVRLFQES